MARQLWLLRHGDAVPHGARPDSERELTPRGEHQARIAGGAFARMGIEFAACYSSPKVRARDTAKLAAEKLGVEPEIVEVLAEGFEVANARELLEAYDDGACVLFVGHEPDFSQIVHDLSGARIDLKKGGAAALKVSGSGGELIVLLRPAELETMCG